MSDRLYIQYTSNRLYIQYTSNRLYLQYTSNRLYIQICTNCSSKTKRANSSAQTATPNYKCASSKTTCKQFRTNCDPSLQTCKQWKMWSRQNFWRIASCDSQTEKQSRHMMHATCHTIKCSEKQAARAGCTGTHTHELCSNVWSVVSIAGLQLQSMACLKDVAMDGLVKRDVRATDGLYQYWWLVSVQRKNFHQIAADRGSKPPANASRHVAKCTPTDTPIRTCTQAHTETRSPPVDSGDTLHCAVLGVVFVGGPVQPTWVLRSLHQENKTTYKWSATSSDYLLFICV